MLGVLDDQLQTLVFQLYVLLDKYLEEIPETMKPTKRGEVLKGHRSTSVSGTIGQFAQ